MKILPILFGLCLPALQTLAVGVPAPLLEPAMRSSVSRPLLAALHGEEAKRSIRGCKKLWVQVNLVLADKDPAQASLTTDLRLSDLEGGLRQAGFSLLAAKDNSLALGLRPTLVLTVQFVPKGTEGNGDGLYWVMLEALQDVTPLGGEVVTLPTWAALSKPILATDDHAQDIAAVRSEARGCIQAFIIAAQENKDKD
jgi:hypothetical protein